MYDDLIHMLSLYTYPVSGPSAASDACPAGLSSPAPQRCPAPQHCIAQFQASVKNSDLHHNLLKQRSGAAVDEGPAAS